uniref:Interleukin 17 receptor C n=1 Tax=Catharus ustulatus TaxID=91951 RepID=A0A8C3VFN4_CATUS
MVPTPPRAWGLLPYAGLSVPPDADVLCGTELPGPRHGLALARLRLEPALRCSEPTACVPCLEARVRLALSPATSTATESRLAAQPGTSGTEDGAQWSPATGATSSQPNVTGLLLLSGHAYASSHCVAVEVWAPLLGGGFPAQGWVIFRCFEAPLGSELHISAYMNSRGRQRLSQQQRVPGKPQHVPCSDPSPSAAALPLPAGGHLTKHCRGGKVPLKRGSKLRISPSGISRGPARSQSQHSYFSCLSPHSQVWPEIQDPLRATLCPFSHDAEAWERLWAQSQLVLHIEGQVLTCILSAPCDLPAELVPCWQPVPSRPCQPLPGLQQPARGQVSGEFRGLWPHPNICVQVGHHSAPQLPHGQPHITPRGPHCGATGDLCWVLGALGGCRSCPADLRTHWALVWMGVLLGTACLLLLLLMKKEDMKGEWCLLQGRRALLVHAAEPVAERAACALMAALHSLGLTVVAAPGGGSGVAALGPLPWLHAQHHRALRDGDTIILLLSPAAVAAAHQWDTGARVVPESGAAGSSLGPQHNPDPDDVPTVAPCEVFAAALSCAMPVLAVSSGHYVVAWLEALVPAVPQALWAAPAFALPSEMEGFLQALAGPARHRGRWLEPYVAVVAEALERAVGE